MIKQIKQISWLKIALTCLVLLFFLKACAGLLGIDDGFSSSEGNAAIQEIDEDFKIPSDTIKNAYYAIYAKGAMPADPNFHYRFEIDRQVLDSFIKKRKFKADTKRVDCFSEYSRDVGDWWQPAEVRSKACFKWNEKNTDYYMAFKDLDSKTARVYIFGYNN